MIWFTADWHDKHHNIIKYCNRKMRNVEEMRKVLFKNFRKKVDYGDELYYLGDLAWNPESARECFNLFDELELKVTYILGNHDKRIRQVIDKRADSVHELLRIRIPDKDGQNGFRNIVLCHYALLSWEGSCHDSICCFGHSHGNLNKFINERLPNSPLFDVGVDCWKFYPVSVDEILRKYKEMKVVEHID